MLFQKEFFETVDFGKKRITKKHATFPVRKELYMLMMVAVVLKINFQSGGFNIMQVLSSMAR